MEKTGFKVICGAPTTLAAKGLMMMMMMMDGWGLLHSTGMAGVGYTALRWLGVGYTALGWLGVGYTALGWLG